MAVLSDKTLRERIANNELILDGRPERATHCSYEFTAAKIIFGGSSEFRTISESGETVSPARLVWVRARETISVPPNMVGLWIQTQSLSRQGVLLLNISLVEPGYKGYLTAVLVNFGKKDVVIGPTTTIAKVVFLALDDHAIDEVKPSDSESYDGLILEMAANAPASFLRLESFLPQLKEQAEEKLKFIDEQLTWKSEAIHKEAARSMGMAATQAKSEIANDLRGVLRGSVVRWWGSALLGFAAACGAVWFGVITLLPELIASHSNVDELVQRAMKVQEARKGETLSGRLDAQAAEIEALGRQLADLESEQ